MNRNDSPSASSGAPASLAPPASSGSSAARSSANGHNVATMGIEEEYQIVDATTGELRPRGQTVLHDAQGDLGEEVQPELKLSQIEIASPICASLSEIRTQLVRSRKGIIEAARRHGCEIIAAGSHPFSDWHNQPLTPKPRYRQLMEEFKQFAREQVIFGCHVHVGIDDRELAVQVLTRARAWLSPLLALAGNSPFWMGDNTGYSSYRTSVWSRWPMAGPPLPFDSYEEYEALVKMLVATGDLEDASKIYWDIRIPEHLPTVEFRVTDVCLSVDEAVMIAGLTRAIARTCYEESTRNAPYTKIRHEVIRVAHWHAARYGLDAELVDVAAGTHVPARDYIERFLNWLRPALESYGDWEEGSEIVRNVVQHGNGAARQRAVYARHGDWQELTAFLIQETARGVA